MTRPDLDDERRHLLEFTRRLLRLRASEPVFRRRSFFQGRPVTGTTVKDVYPVRPPGREMQQEDWSTPLFPPPRAAGRPGRAGRLRHDRL